MNMEQPIEQPKPAVRSSKLVVDGVGSGANVCVDCGGHGWVEDFATMSLAGYCKTCGGTGRAAAAPGRKDTDVR